MLLIKQRYLTLYNSVCKFSCSILASQKTYDGVRDIYGGITVDTAKEPCTQKEFTDLLEGSLGKWRSEARRCVWFKVNIKDAPFVPILAKKGFNFHHARDDFVMMYKWLPLDSKPNLPPSGHINLGVGAMVFNKKEQLLAVSEKHYDYPHWKLPGGYVDRGEDIIDAAVREVREETGVNAVFESLVTFRHAHNMQFGNSDIYVLMMFSAASEEICMSQRELMACKWMEVEEYTTHPNVHSFNRFIVKRALEYKKMNMKLDLKKRTLKWSRFVRDIYYLSVEDYK